jgi:hypothetical protein
LILAALPLAVACGGGIPGMAGGPQMAGGGGGARPAYNNCKQQEEVGDASACWKLFKKQYEGVAAPEMMDHANDYVAAHEGEGAHQKRQQADAASSQATTESPISSTPTNVNAGGTTSPSTQAGPSDNLPPQTVSFSDCYANFTPGPDPQAALQALTDKCGAPCGMIPVGDPVHNSQGASDAPDVFPVHLDGDHCFRIFVVGDSAITSVVAKLTDNSGNEVAGDPSGDRFPVVPTRRAYCPQGPGDFKFVVSVLTGGGSYYVQLWKGARTNGDSSGGPTPGAVTTND